MMIDWQTDDLRNMGMELSLETQQSMEQYLLRGWAPGGYLTAMLARDYERAFACADIGNRQTIWVLWSWIRNYAPRHCHGSYAAINLWRDDVGGHRTAWATEQEKKFIWRKLKETE